MIRAKDNGATNSFPSLPTLVALVLLTRVAFAFVVWKINGLNGFLGPDTSSYVAPAQSLLHGSFLSDDGQSEIYRTPGYPVLLLPAVAWHHFAAIALLENLFLAAVCAWFVYHIARDIFPTSNAGSWAVIFYCFEFSGLLYSAKALAETLFCTQLVFFVWLLIRFLRRPTFWRLALSAFALGWATYTRPVGLYLGLCLTPILLLLPRSLPFTQRVFRALVFPLTLALTLVPWVLRNAAVADYAGFAPVSDYVLYFYSAPAVQAKLESKSLFQTQQEFGYGGLPYVKNEPYLQRHPEQRGWSQGQIVRFWDSQARKIIVPHLPSYAFIYLQGCATMLLDPGATELLKILRLYPEHGGLLVRTVDQGYARAVIWLVQKYPSAGVALLLLGVQLAIFYALALAGLRRIPLDVALSFLFMALSFLLLSGGPGAVPRYRTPMMPLVCISAGTAVASWKERKNSAIIATRDAAKSSAQPS